MKTDSIIIQQLIEKSTKLQHQVDSMQMQQKLNELAYKFEHSSKIAAEAQTFYEASWNKLMWAVMGIGGILAFVIPYLMGIKERNDIKKIKEDFEEKINTFNENLKLSGNYNRIQTYIITGMFQTGYDGISLLSAAFSDIHSVKEHPDVTSNFVKSLVGYINDEFKDQKDQKDIRRLLDSIVDEYYKLPNVLQSDETKRIIERMKV